MARERAGDEGEPCIWNRPRPEEWEVVRFAEVATPVRRRLTGKPKNVLMISSTQGFIRQSEKYGRFMAGESLNRYVELHDGEFAYNKGNSKTYPQGCIFQLRSFGEAAVPHVYFCFALNEQKLLPEFASHYFRAGGLNLQLKRIINTGVRNNGLLNINESQFYSVHVPVPPVPEQGRIAAVLSSVDDAIRCGESVCAGVEKVKQGLLSDLMSEGVPGQHSSFVESEVGKVPADWAVQPVSDLVAEGTAITYGIVQAGPHVAGGVPYLRTGDVKEAGIDVEKLGRTSREIASQFKRSEVRAGDLVICIRASVGTVVMVPSELDGANLTQGTARIAPGPRVNGRFLLWALRSAGLQSWIGQQCKGSTFREITLARLRELPVPVPSLAEQAAIANALDACEARTKAEVEALAALRRLRIALCTSLLSGQLRVPEVIKARQ